MSNPEGRQDSGDAVDWRVEKPEGGAWGVRGVEEEESKDRPNLTVETWLLRTRELEN
jgi:hypothetical protein